MLTRFLSFWCVLWSVQVGLAADYRVGPGQALAEIEAVPWESLEPGDRVSIYARPEPYRSKWVLCRRGTKERPIVVIGIPDAQGKLPVIDGRDAVMRPALNYWGAARGIIKIGGANRPADTTPAHLVLDSLEIRSARPPFQFRGRDGVETYLKNAAPIFIEKGEHIVIRNCVLHDSGNGLFTSPETRDILVEHCRIFDNGIEGSILEHNNYTTSDGITFQFNQFGPLRQGCLGNSLKDRSAGLVVRYNWIEGGNRALDLVDHHWQGAAAERYRETFVYGNVLVKLDDQGNNQVVHYGGDSGKLQEYRQGTLHFYHNTVVSQRPETTAVFRLSSPAERVDCYNNIFYVPTPGRHLAVFGGTGQVVLFDNWLKSGWRTTHTAGDGTVTEAGETSVGESPGFVDFDRRDYRLTAQSPALGTGATLPQTLLTRHPVNWSYSPLLGSPLPRPADERSVGALPVVR